MEERDRLLFKQLEKELSTIEDLEEKHEEIPQEKPCPICENPLEDGYCFLCNKDEEELERKSLYGYTEEIEEF